MIDARSTIKESFRYKQDMKTNFVKKSLKKKPPLCVGIFGIFGFYSLPIRRAAFSDFIQAKGRLIRPSSLQ